MTPTRDLIQEYYEANYDILCRHFSYKAGGLYNAEDVVQEGFCRALYFSHSFDPERGVLATWVGAILNRVFKDFMSEERNQGMSLDEAKYEEPTTPLTGYEQLFLEELSGEIDSSYNRNILYLYFLREYKVREVCQVLDVKPETVRQTVWRFKKEVVDKYGRLSTDTS